MASAKKIIRKTRKVLAWILLVVLVMVLGLLIFINLPAGKRFIKARVENYLRETLHTTVAIGSLDYSLPNWLELKNIYVEDQKKDTLLYGGELRVDLDMFKLLRGNTDIQKIYLKDILANVSRAENDSSFNYQFIINAFSGNKAETVHKDTAEMKLTLNRLILDNVSLNFKDRFAGNDMKAVIKNLDITTKKFQPDRMIFNVDELTAKGVQFFMTTCKELPVPSTSPRPDTTGKSYPLFTAANKIQLKDVEVQIDNKISGLYYSNKITTLSGANLFFSIGQSKGTADSLSIDSTSVVFSSPKTISAGAKNDSQPTPAATPWLFAAKQLNIQRTQVRFDDNNKPARGGLDFAHLDAKNINAAVSGFRYSRDTISARVSQFAFMDKGGFTLDTTHVNFLFSDTLLSATELYVKTPGTLIQKSIRLRYNRVAAITGYPQNTTLAAELTNTTIAFNDLYTLMPSLEKSLPKAQFANQYLTINTGLQGSLQLLNIPYMQLGGLSGSRFSARGTLHNITDAGKFSFDLFINQANIFKKDLFRFIPPESQGQFAKLPDVITLSGRFTGNKNDIVAGISTSASNLAFTGRINLKNISTPGRLTYDLDISSASFSRSLAEGFLPPALLQQLELPPQVSASGKLAGNTENITTDLKISSGYGPLTVKGYIKNIKDPQRANYNLYITTPGFAIGRLIKQDSILGSIAGNFTARGTGFDYKTMRSSVKADVSALQYNKYNYRNTLINADLSGGIIKSTGSIRDSSISLAYSLDADVRNKYPVFDAEISIDTIQLNKLNLTTDTLNFSLHTKVKGKSLQPRSLDAALFIDSILMQKGQNKYHLDTLSLIASSANGIDSIVLDAPIANIRAGGAFDYDKISLSLQQYINSYYKLPGYTPASTNIPDQQFAVKGVIYPNPVVTGFVPGLNSYDPIQFSGSYSSAGTDSPLRFQATIPHLLYTTTSLSNASIDVNSGNGRINYEAKFDTLRTAGNLLYATNISGAAAKDSLSFNAVTRDAENINWFGAAAVAFVKDDVYSFRMKDTLLLNYEKWNVSPGNYISYSPQGLIVNDLTITSDSAKIAVQSRQLVPDSPVDIAVNNFNLKSVSSLLKKDTILVSGLLDVKATVSDFKKVLPSFTGTASVTGLQYLQIPVGNITANAQKVSENNIAASLALTGKGNDLSVKGNYYLNNTEKQFDADFQLKQFNPGTAEAFSAGQLQRARGNISGNIKLDGKFADPRWNGQLRFDTVQFVLTQLGSLYKIDGQQIALNYPAVNFSQFTIRDSLNHTLKINGNITVRGPVDYRLGLNINANDFILVNAKKTINSQVYGYGSVDVNVAIKGTSAEPDIQGNIALNDKSDVYIVLPQASYAKDDGKTIVRFIDQDTFNINPPVVKLEPEKEKVAAFARFLNYNLNINVTKAAALTILLDPNTGDEIRVQGDANLNAGVDPGGNIVLAGVYELDKGYYDLHYQILKRKFNLLKGSTITFSGTPLNATANITAEYIANTSSKSLLDNEVADVPSTLASSFNQKLPFRVILYITGPLSKPDINFDIQLPEQSSLINNDLRTTIENKLQQVRTDQALINKQVFSLLLFNRFVSEQSSDFFKGNGTNFNDMARQSVSQFLSSALNEIASDLIKGIDIDLNLNSYDDYSTGGSTGRTDLNVAVSKSFANDRLTVSVGKNFGIEGQDAAAKAGTTNSSGFKPDVTVSYKLTTDGKYMLRAYTKNQYEAVLDGFVVETGVAFVVTMDYDKFRELFGKKKKAKGKRK